MKEEFVSIARICPMCGTKTAIVITESQHRRIIKRQENIQDILPEMSLSDREVLISGICHSCQDGFFDTDEEEAGW